MINHIFDWLNNTRVFRYLDARSKIRRVCHQRHADLTKNVLKLLLMPESNLTQLWKDEIHSVLHLIQNSIISKNDYKNWLIYSPGYDVRDISDLVIIFSSKYSAEPWRVKEFCDKDLYVIGLNQKHFFMTDIYNTYKTVMFQICTSLHNDTWWDEDVFQAFFEQSEIQENKPILTLVK